MTSTGDTILAVHDELNANPIRLTYNPKNFKYTQTQGDISFTITRETVDDICSVPAFYALALNEKIDDWDSKKILIETVFEEVCGIEFHRKQLGRNPDNQYSLDSSMTETFRLRAFVFASKMVDRVLEHIFNKKPIDEVTD